MRVRMGGYTIGMVTICNAGRIKLFTERRRDKPSSAGVIEQQECCENATKRAALQHYKLVRL